MLEKPWNAPFHPAEFFVQDFLEPLEMSREDAAAALQLTMDEMTPFFREEAPVTGDLAIRLSSAFGCSADFWLRLQNRHDLDVARAKGTPELPRIPQLIAAE